MSSMGGVTGLAGTTVSQRDGAGDHLLVAAGHREEAKHSKNTKKKKLDKQGERTFTPPR